MNGDLDDAGVQAGECQEQLKERVKNSAAIYSRRKDCIAIKEKLQALVTDKDYWQTLASFIHGQCSKIKYDEIMARCLPTNEMKILHNELIRSIIFNAHFSMMPPPGVEIPHPKSPIRPAKAPTPVSQVKTASFMTFTAADLHHLPSINQLGSRIGVLIHSDKYKYEPKATSAILTELKKFIKQILAKSLELSEADDVRVNGHAHICVEHVQQVLKMNSQLATVLSPSVISKFDMASK